MPDEPESIGSGIGPLLADYLPLMPSGARRAGAAKVMAARVGRDPSFLVTDPIKTQLAAMGIGAIGGAYTEGAGTPVRAAATILPLLLTQALRRREIKSIQKDYDRKSRLRLRELDEEDLLGGMGGSARLGAVGAYEAMRQRKYQDIGHLSEAGDALALTAGPMHLPVTNWLDHRSADRLRKEADFSDQKNSPTIPLMLAAGLLSSAGLGAARVWNHREMQSATPMPTDQWSPLIQEISGGKPLVYSGEGIGNAGYGKPRNDLEASQFMRYLDGFQDTEPAPRSTFFDRRPALDEKSRLRRLMEHGAVFADRKMSKPVIAHEAGHAKIENTPGVLRALQRHVYPYGSALAPLAGVGSMAAGLASGGAIRGALLGTGIGALTNIGVVAPEIGASYHASKALNEKGQLEGGHVRGLAAALSTYLAAGVLPSTIAGAAGGWISGRRKKKRELDDAEKSASLSKLRPIAEKLRWLYSQRSGEQVLDAAAGAAAAVVAGFSKLLSDTQDGPATLESKIKAAAVSDEILTQLIEAKKHSDARRYAMKHAILRRLITNHPDQFAEDSRSKGIVGVTHGPTNFRIHVPSGHIPAPLEKLARAVPRSLLETLKAVKGLPADRRGKFVGQQAQKAMEGSLAGAVDYLKSSPRVHGALRNLADYRIMDPANRARHMTVGGGALGLLGGATGAVTGGDGERASGGIVGAGLGALAGAGAGRYLPRGLQIGAGRVLTNLVDPHIYDSKMHLGSIVGGLRRAGALGVIKSVVKDQPIHPIAPARHALFRDFFDLPRFAGTEGVFKDVGRDAAGMRTLRHNVRDAGARADLRDIHGARLRTLTGDGSAAKHMQRGQQTLTSGGSPGNFHVQPDGQWEDVWDFGLHKGQDINSPETLLRALVSPFGTPSKVVGKTLNESQVLRFSPMTNHRLNQIHPSFTEPVMNRAVRGAGIDRKQLSSFIRSKLNDGDKNPVMRSIARRAEGKPYNLLQDLAKSENTTTSDMREFLGGAARRSRQAHDRSPKWTPGDLKSMFSTRVPGASSAEVGNAIDQLSPAQQKDLRAGLTQWSAQGRPPGGERAVLAKVLGFEPGDLSTLLS